MRGTDVGQRNDAVFVHGAVDRAAAELSRLALSPQTCRAMCKAWHRFGRFATAHHSQPRVDDLSPALVRDFVCARHDDGALPSVAAMHWRRSAMRLLFRIWRDVGLADGDPTLDLQLPRRSPLHTRPLTDDEVALCRWAALATASETRLPAVWALAEAGAGSGEIAFVRGTDVDVRARSVTLGGTTKTDARTVPLTEWGAVQLARRIDRPDREPSTAVVYEGAGSPESAQASVSGAIGDALRRAGLGEEPDVRPRSVTAWVGRRIFDETGQVEAVAQRLGLRSLDRAAALIGWDWRNR
jgi:integrase/recombinase XerC